MNYRELVSITGMPGLYQLIATKSDGAIVRNIADGATKFVAARQHHVTALDGIEVYTQAENISLLEVFITFKQNIALLEGFDVAKADNNKIKEIFGKLLPQRDEDRIYVSDMKKMIKWFGILNDKGLLELTEEAPATEETTAVAEAPVVETAAEEKPKAKRTTKKKEVTEDAATTEASTEEKPKKTTRKKATPKSEE